MAWILCVPRFQSTRELYWGRNLHMDMVSTVLIPTRVPVEYHNSSWDASLVARGTRLVVIHTAREHGTAPTNIYIHICVYAYM